MASSYDDHAELNNENTFPAWITSRCEIQNFLSYVYHFNGHSIVVLCVIKFISSCEVILLFCWVIVKFLFSCVIVLLCCGVVV